MQVETTNEKLAVFGSYIDIALDTEKEANGMIKAGWFNGAEQAVNIFGSEWIHFAMLNKRDAAIVAIAKRHVESLKAGNAEQAKTFKEYASGIKSMVTEKVKARSDNGGNPREQLRRFLTYCIEIAKLTAIYVPGESKGPGTKAGTTSYDKVAEALRVLRNHLSQCEPQAVENVLTLWPDIEQAAIEDGLLKESV